MSDEPKIDERGNCDLLERLLHCEPSPAEPPREGEVPLSLIGTLVAHEITESQSDSELARAYFYSK